MRVTCNNCGTVFDSPFCPNCGAPEQLQDNLQQINQQSSLIPPNNQYQQNQYIPNPNMQTPKNKKHGCLFYGLMGLGFLLFLFIFISFVTAFFNGFKNGLRDAVNTSSLKSNNTVKETPIPDEYLSDDEVQYLYTNPKDYIGKHVKISGIVFGDPENDKNGVYFQMFQDPTNNEHNTIVVYYGKLNIKDGDYVTIDGEVHDKFDGENLLGGSVSAPSIIADSVEISTYKDVVSPSEKTMLVNKTVKQNGYDVTVDKIEFSKIETRVYVTVNNSGKSNFSAYSYDMKIIQNKKQYEEQSNYDADYPEVQTDLKPGTTTNGVICFPVISQTDKFTIYIDGGSDNWDENFKEYKFDISNN